ncbi:MAG: hypothetical protein ACHQWU_16295 [Gemmatimonadales bacterium]
MHSRTLAVYDAMRRVAEFIDQNPDLRARAAESTALAHFTNVISDFEALRAEEAMSDVNLQELRAVRRMLLNHVAHALRRIHATAKLISSDGRALPDLTPPDPRQFLLHYVPYALAHVDVAQRNVDAFLEAGLHPSVLDETRRLIPQLVEADRRYSYADAMAGTILTRVEAVVGEARRRMRQLALELQPAMTPASRAQWRQVALIGRVHRVKALAPPTEFKLLPAVAHEAPSASD